MATVERLIFVIAEKRGPKQARAVFLGFTKLLTKLPRNGKIGLGANTR